MEKATRKFMVRPTDLMNNWTEGEPSEQPLETREKRLPRKAQGLELAYRQRMNTTQVIDSLAAKEIQPWYTWKRGRRGHLNCTIPQKTHGSERFEQ